MAAQLFLVTPATADPQTFPKVLMAMLTSAPVSAILVQRGDRDDAEYARLATAIINIGQGAGSAVLLENDAALAKRLGADGVHIAGDASAIKAALKTLKPAMIVGAAPALSRHDAMTAGELDVDYLFFGPLDGTADPAAHELALWWAQTFEIPAVLSDPAVTPDDVTAMPVEFLALAAGFWSNPDPVAAIARFATALEQV